MKIVVFGLSISSAWGNGHATLLRGLFRALNSDGHEIHFFERDTPYYSAHRDADSFPFAQLHLYSEWDATLPVIHRHLADADASMVTSYCADGAAASRLIAEFEPPCSIFYDMDTPVTLSRLTSGEQVDYIPAEGLAACDLVLSYTGGQALTLLREKLKARRVETLYGWVDPAVHHTAHPVKEFRADLSYLGTYARDRQPALEELLIQAARCLPEHRFLIAGAMFPKAQESARNIVHLDHVAPSLHPAFFSSSRLTLNITRASMAAMGYCPSGRLFEAAACGTPVISDWWEGLDEFFTPGEEILIASSSAESIEAITQDDDALKHMGARAKERALDCHTAQIRARQLIGLIESSHSREPQTEDVALYNGA